MRYLFISIIAFNSPFVAADVKAADNKCKNIAVAQLEALSGSVFYDPESNGNWQAAQLNDVMCEGSRVRVEANSRATLSLQPQDIHLSLDQGTVLSLNDLSPEKPTLLSLLKGFIHLMSRTPKHLQITSPIANAGPEGTEFAMRVDDSSASLWVFEGGVKFFNDQGSLHLNPGQEAQALAGQAPRIQINIKPEDAVNWALYYPPVLPFPEANSNIDSTIRQAILDYRHGHVDQALKRLDALTSVQQTSYFHKVRGAMRLSVGQDALAMQDIQALLISNPKDAEALALKAIRALSQNRKDEAHHLATEAVQANPQSASAYSALSYIEQSQFHLEKAQAAADQAVELAPHDAMVWARKAELELSQGLTKESLQNAQHALTLDASLERTQTVMGFADLTSMDTDAALYRFEKAIQLDSSSPLPRLGLGLAKIRQGDLQAGRQDLEIAAVLDPNDSIIRSYLGKAYYEEKRNLLAEDQFSLAKSNDPKDPTPYFYNAIEKQTENRPVEALENMQKALELNDNRAIYRSKQTLDSDLASRSAAQGRIYNDLGFSQRALFEGWKSVNESPNDYSSHRFLADAYQNQPGLDTSRTSELLQSQLLQPLNLTPVQPSLGEQNLLILKGTGPSQMSFNEFNPLFNRNGFALHTSAIAGNFNTFGNEVAQSGVLNKFSYNLGQFHYETDGYRPNNGINQNLYNAFFQANVSPTLSLQAEYRHKDLVQGDLGQQRMTYYPQQDESFLNYDPIFQREINHERYRFGTNYKLSVSSQFIGSVIFSDQLQNFDYSPSNIRDRDYLAETMYQGKWENFNIILGGGDYKANRHFTDVSLNGRAEIYRRTNGFIYTNTRFPTNSVWTLGINVENYLRPSETFNSYSETLVNPKIGLTWNFGRFASIRLAALRGGNNTLNDYASIEPTQVAGFNQLFHDRQGTVFWRYGVGIDQKISAKFFWGIEASLRNLTTNPFRKLFPDDPSQKWQEQNYRAYINWAPRNDFALSLNYRMEKFTTNLDRPTFDTNNDENSTSYLRNKFPDTKTHIGIFSARYFHNSGFFLQMEPMLVHQEVDGADAYGATPIKTFESFFLLDSSIGYRLPKRLGILKFQVKNIFDEKFNYQNEWWRTENYEISPQFFPARTFTCNLLITL